MINQGGSSFRGYRQLNVGFWPEAGGKRFCCSEFRTKHPFPTLNDDCRAGSGEIEISHEGQPPAGSTVPTGSYNIAQNLGLTCISAKISEVASHIF